jgi:hypothetical protein
MLTYYLPIVKQAFACIEKPSFQLEARFFYDQ